jgi:hypothetical protein
MTGVKLVMYSVPPDTAESERMSDVLLGRWEEAGRGHAPVAGYLTMFQLTLSIRLRVRKFLLEFGGAGKMDIREAN